MICPKCGEACGDLEQVCGKCGASLTGQDVSAVAEQAAVEPEGAEPPAPKKKSAKLVIAAVAAVAVIGGGAFGIMKLTEKDPKEVVIDAFKNVYTEEQARPLEEIFGFSQLQENSLKTNMEGGLTLVMDSCSEEAANAYAGSGFRVAGKNDVENKKYSADIDVIYSGMDLLTLDIYYGDEMLMASVPELVEKVFVLDLGDGLADRIKESPTLGPVLEDQEVDVEGLFDFLKENFDKAGTEKAADPYDFKGLINRYKEGCKAQENFKAALTVEKAGKKSCQMDGAEVTCKGYQVHISKDSIMEFLRTSSDFFLQDEQLKQAYLENLEMSTKMMSFFGTSDVSMSAEELQEQTYEEVREQVAEAIDQFDKALQDVDMTVFVDKKGRLAALEGSTTVLSENDEGAEESVPVSFAVSLQGGTYLTQNAQASVTVEEDGETVKVELTKTGTYSGGKLECNYLVSVDQGFLEFGGNYTEDSKEFAVYGRLQAEGTEVCSLEAAGLVEQLEKGVALEASLDNISLKVQGMPEDEPLEITSSGKYYLRPLTDEVNVPEGEQMDVLAATEEDWQAVLMKAAFSFISLAGQIEGVQ